MKKLLLTLGAIAALGASATAADLPARTDTRAPAMIDPVYNWTGFYLGAGLGWQRDQTDWETTEISNPARTPAVANRLGLGGPTATFDSNTLRFAGYGGYNVQLSSVVVGVEGDLGTGFNSKRSLNYIPGTVFGPLGSNTPLGDTTTVEQRWNGSIRGRAGFLATPTILIYGTGGFAFQEVKNTLACPTSNSRWCVADRTESSSKLFQGWTVGGGVEGVVTGNWLARAEYRYSDLGTFKSSYFLNTNTDEVFATTRLRTSAVTVGLAYKFGGPTRY